ncbi:phosphonoacetaldehyde reductase [Streptomyces aureocirculatus]|uniref:phosphonoacetaldehyde reductase n=1 Tax=Streptomyces aureocirculatus TaxID=67275 RepID=UPI00068C8CA3|nr:phosphonoacetaldehyde reductase [Streptomyces aureocirculatus]
MAADSGGHGGLGGHDGHDGHGVPGRHSGVEVVFGAGAVRRLDAMVDSYGARRVLVVATEGGLRRAGFGHWLESPRHHLFSGFRPNPALDDVLAGCALRDRVGPDLVVGLGGGSAMDVAKMVRALPADGAAARACLGTGAAPLPVAGDLVLVPTTSGTGSEVTQFATVFDGEHKFSFDHPTAAATRSVVDPELTATCPAEVTTSCAMDALCHAVESLWARRSQEGSRADALRALGALTGPLGDGVKDTSPAVREQLARAAIDAGRAINVTRTTAAHAFAYRLTSRYGVPHGVACLLNLQWLYAYNTERYGTHCEDDRGRAHVRAQLDAVAAAFGLDPVDVPGRLGELLAQSAWSPRLSDYGLTDRELPDYVAAGLGSTARAANNPVRLDESLVLRALRAVH